MGLIISHDCFEGPYSVFNRFRYSLGHQIGIDLNEYRGYNKGGDKSLGSIKHGLMPLFNHSDCDGKLTVKECKSIVSGLNDVLSNFDEKIEADYDFKERIIRFRDGCLYAISKNQKLKFY